MTQRVAPPEPPQTRLQRVLPWVDLVTKLLTAAAAGMALWRGYL